MEVDDQKPVLIQKREVDLNVNFVDDEDLQAALTRQRRAKMRERRVARPEDIARRGESSFIPLPSPLLFLYFS